MLKSTNGTTLNIYYIKRSIFFYAFSVFIYGTIYLDKIRQSEFVKKELPFIEITHMLRLLICKMETKNKMGQICL